MQKSGTLWPRPPGPLRTMPGRCVCLALQSSGRCLGVPAHVLPPTTHQAKAMSSGGTMARPSVPLPPAPPPASCSCMHCPDRLRERSAGSHTHS